MMHWKVNLFLLMTVGCLASTAIAQAPDLPPPGAPPMKGGMVSMRVNDMDAEPVKGAPFCATVVTDHTQQFADGNRIHTSDNSLLCRDSEGRTRREATLNLMGMATGKEPKLITIVDPIAGVRYTLDTERKVAFKGPIGGPTQFAIKAGAPAPPEKGEQVMLYQRFSTGAPGPGGDVVFRRSGEGMGGPAPTTESLGDQTISGVHATGTRISTTIPAGQMGNEQPIVTTSERWYSPELKATVLSKHDDPWSGELKTSLTNVNTAEPDASLFAVPDDYKVVDQKAGPFVMKLPPPEKPPK